MSIKSKNILYQQQDNPNQNTLWLVDGVGNANFMPLANYVRYLGRKKILRRWRRFYETLELT